MALIKCPDCGNNISSNATVCIHCGRPMKNVSDNDNYVDYTKKSVWDSFSELLVKENYEKRGWTPFLW